MVAGIENPMAEIDVQRISNIVGIDLGQRNIATTYSPEKVRNAMLALITSAETGPILPKRPGTVP